MSSHYVYVFIFLQQFFIMESRLVAWPEREGLPHAGFRFDYV